jgi:hypothetical protein
MVECRLVDEGASKGSALVCTTIKVALKNHGIRGARPLWPSTA